jgi:hypothetical protein
MYQVKRTVYLKEYPKFWEKLHRAVIRLGGQTSALGAERIIKDEFGIEVDIRSADITGTVMMDEGTYSWFILQWS